MLNLQIYRHLKINFQKMGQHTGRRQVANPRHQTPQGKSVTKHGNYLQNILVENISMT